MKGRKRTQSQSLLPEIFVKSDLKIDNFFLIIIVVVKLVVSVIIKVVV